MNETRRMQAAIDLSNAARIIRRIDRLLSELSENDYAELDQLVSRLLVISRKLALVERRDTA